MSITRRNLSVYLDGVTNRTKVDGGIKKRENAGSLELAVATGFDWIGASRSCCFLETRARIPRQLDLVTALIFFRWY